MAARASAAAAAGEVGLGAGGSGSHAGVDADADAGAADAGAAAAVGAAAVAAGEDGGAGHGHLTHHRIGARAGPGQSQAAEFTAQPAQSAFELGTGLMEAAAQLRTPDEILQEAAARQQQLLQRPQPRPQDQVRMSALTPPRLARGFVPPAPTLSGGSAFATPVDAQQQQQRQGMSRRMTGRGQHERFGADWSPLNTPEGQLQPLEAAKESTIQGGREEKRSPSERRRDSRTPSPPRAAPKATDGASASS